VVQVRPVPRQERMCLVHVLLARHRGRVVSGVLRAVETSYIAFRGTDAIERNDHDEQRQPEEQENRTEGANDASSGRSAGGWRRHPLKDSGERWHR
jgi:hypothetical protein